MRGGRYHYIRLSRLKKFITSLALAAAFLSTDLHWSVMQTVTWVHMIHQSESTASFSDKLISTVTGEAPCKHCQALAEEKGSERNEILSLLGKGPLLASVTVEQWHLSRCGYELFALRSPACTPGLLAVSGIDHPPRA